MDGELSDDDEYEYMSEFDADDIEMIRSAQRASFFEAWESSRPRNELNEIWIKAKGDFVKANEVMLVCIDDTCLPSPQTSRKASGMTAGAIALWESLPTSHGKYKLPPKKKALYDTHFVLSQLRDEALVLKKRPLNSSPQESTAKRRRKI